MTDTPKMDKATVSSLPQYSGDGYSYGGSVVLTIGDRSFLIGETREDRYFAQHLADAWNAYSKPEEPKF